MSLLDTAISFAALAHADQRRKYSGEPYICHPIEVMQTVRSVTHTEEMLIAAVLHDVIEDTPVTELEIGRRFGDDVLRLVVELTEPVIEGNRATRKAAEVERLASISGAAQTIKYADLISNTVSIVRYDRGFAKVYLQEKAQALDVMVCGDAGLRDRAFKALRSGEMSLSLAAMAGGQHP